MKYKLHKSICFYAIVLASIFIVYNLSVHDGGFCTNLMIGRGGDGIIEGYFCVIVMASVFFTSILAMNTSWYPDMILYVGYTIEWLLIFFIVLIIGFLVKLFYRVFRKILHVAPSLKKKVVEEHESIK